MSSLFTRPLSAIALSSLALSVAACGSTSNDAAPLPPATCASCAAEAAAGAEDASAGHAPPSSSGAADAASPRPVVLTGDIDLCGPNTYAGTLVIAKGSHVTCASGELSIDADAILLEAGASLTVAPTSTRVSGLDAHPCSLGSYSSYSGASGAGHGGYGASGGNGYDVNSGANGIPACSPCRAPMGGERFGSDEDLVIEPGAKGGDGCQGGGPTCPKGNALAGGRGGGVVRLTAKTAIRIDGEVRADGEPGERYNTQFNGGSGGAGGGSGGGILLRANAVVIGATGVVSAAGGAGSAGWNYGACTSGSAQGPFNAKGGAGGNGRVKIGWAQGAQPFSTPGTIVGTFTSAPYP
ncbi:MAG: hypothetical protein U0235_01040 [Polyangiaceae bacterium]